MEDKNIKEPLIPPGTEEQELRSTFMQQLKLLTYKNLLITFKNPKNIIFLIITPFLLSLFLFAFQQLATNNGNITIQHPDVNALPVFPRCGWDDCISLDVRLAAQSSGKTIVDYEWINSVVNGVKIKTGVDAYIGKNVITTFEDLQKYYD